MNFRKSIRLHPSAYGSPDAAFHVVVRTHPEVGSLPSPVRNAVGPTITEQSSGDRIELLAACFMPDHLHLIVRPGKLDVISFLNQWKAWSTRVAWGAGHWGPLWQPSFYDRALRESEVAQALEYVWRNPVEAGLVADSDDWPHLWVAADS